MRCITFLRELPSRILRLAFEKLQKDLIKRCKKAEDSCNAMEDAYSATRAEVAYLMQEYQKLARATGIIQHKLEEILVIPKGACDKPCRTRGEKPESP